MASNGACEPVHCFAEGSDAGIVRMNAALAMIGEAEGAEDGILGAGEFCAEMRGSFFAVGEAGDYSGSEGVIVKHDYGYIINSNSE